MLLRDDLFRRLCQGRELLDQVHPEPLPIRDIARQVGISPFHFIRQFELLFGITPHQHRIQSRLNRAKLLLARGGYSVTDVCMEIGFSSLGSFSDLFTRRVGVAPSVYQRRSRVFIHLPASHPQSLYPGCLSLMTRLPANAFRNFREASPSPLG
jgi:AraC-like DNA-binding protein